MAHILRLIFGALFLCCPFLVHAAFPLQTVYYGITTGTSYSTPEEACVDGGRGNDGNKQRTFLRVDKNPNIGLVCIWHDSIVNMEVGSGVVNSANACPANSDQQGQTCECQAGSNPRQTGTGTICVKPDERTPEQFCEDMASIYNSTLTGSRFARAPGLLNAYADGAMTCREPNQQGGLPEGTGCKHWFTGDFSFQDDSGQWQTNGYSVALTKDDPRSGGSLSCSMGEKPPEKQPEDNCKHGYPGTVNGVDVCIEAWTGDTEGRDHNRITDGQGNVTDITTEIKCKGDQCEVKETRTTRKPDGTTTTTTDTTPSVNRQGYCARNPESSICGRDDEESGRGKGPGARGGAGGGANGGGQNDGDGFCKENPDSPICKQSSFSGSCASNFTCDGDAIQCAIAKEQHIRACKMFDDPSPESLLYEANKGKEGNQTVDLPGNETVPIAGSIDMSNALGTGSCLSDLNVTVWGQTIVLPFSAICPSLAMFGQLLVAVSLLLAARIVMRG